VIYNTNGDYDDGASVFFSTEGFLSVGDSEFAYLSIYPNPANNELTIRNAENANIVIYDILGKRVQSASKINVVQTLDVSNLTSGTYFVSIEKNQQRTVEKLIISK